MNRLKRLLPLILAAALTADASALMMLMIQQGPLTFPVPVVDGGQAAAEAFLRQLVGSRYQSTKSWQLIQRVFDPETRRQMEESAALDGDGNFLIYVNTADSRDQIYPGDQIELPDGSTYTVVPGDTLSGIAARNGTSVQDLVDLNDERFEIWPHASTETIAGTDFRVVRFGETVMARDHWDADTMDEVLVHEAAHTGDGAECSNGLQYGPDGDHGIDEIISPSSAFTEGWAVFKGLGRGHTTNTYWNTVERGTALPTLKVEGAAGEYTTIQCWDLTANDLISNEGEVALALRRIAALDPGAAAVDAAFTASAGADCRALPDFLEAYVTANAGERENVKNALLEIWSGVLSSSQADQLLAGNLPTVAGSIIHRSAIGRSLPYTATERPADNNCDAIVITFDDEPIEAMVISGDPGEGPLGF